MKRGTRRPSVNWTSVSILLSLLSSSTLWGTKQTGTTTSFRTSAHSIRHAPVSSIGCVKALLQTCSDRSAKKPPRANQLPAEKPNERDKDERQTSGRCVNSEVV